MIDLPGWQWVDLLALSVFLFALIGAAVLAWRERGTGTGTGTRKARARGNPDLLEKANAELEGRRLLQEGWQALQAGEEKQAESLLRSALLRFEELGGEGGALIGRARYRLALLYRARGEIEAAIRVLKPIVELRSPHPQHYLLLARLYEHLGRFEGAEWALRAARRRFREGKEIYGVSEWLKRLPEEDYRQTVLLMNGAEHLAPALHRLPGVGPKTAASLIQYGFETLPLLASAEPEDLLIIPRLNPGKARQIIEAARREIAP